MADLVDSDSSELRRLRFAQVSPDPMRLALLLPWVVSFWKKYWVQPAVYCALYKVTSAGGPGNRRAVWNRLDLSVSVA